MKAALAVSTSRRWIDKIAGPERDELEAIKAEYRAGLLPRGRRAVAVAIAESLNRRGVSTIGSHGVESWLQED